MTKMLKKTPSPSKKKQQQNNQTPQPKEQIKICLVENTYEQEIWVACMLAVELLTGCISP